MLLPALDKRADLTVTSTRHLFSGICESKQAGMSQRRGIRTSKAGASQRKELASACPGLSNPRRGDGSILHCGLEPHGTDYS